MITKKPLPTSLECAYRPLQSIKKIQRYCDATNVTIFSFLDDAYYYYEQCLYVTDHYHFELMDRCKNSLSTIKNIIDNADALIDPSIDIILDELISKLKKSLDTRTRIEKMRGLYD